MAAVSDLGGSEYEAILNRLEKLQTVFLSKEALFRSQEYRWPRDALHCWSRRWEYPYTFLHLQSVAQDESRRMMRVVDVGSGVTFFPFAVASLGYQVVCLDIDPVTKRDLDRAIQTVEHSPGSLHCSLIKNGRLPLTDQEADIVYCVSVLEHIENPDDTIREIARVLKSSGLFILTIDLDMVGYLEVGRDKYYELRRVLERFFSFELPEVVIHPTDCLVENRVVSISRQVRFQVKEWLGLALGRSRRRYYPNRTVWGAVLRKRPQVQDA